MRPSQYLELGWTQNALARDRRGAPTHLDSPGAVTWCLMGALACARQKGTINAAQRLELYRVLAQQVQEYGYSSPVVWQNDPQRRKQAVVAIMQQAELEVLGAA